MSAHPRREEEFELYALGLLEAADAGAMEEHAERCVDCRRKMEEARGRVALLAVLAAEQRPAEGVKQRLMERVRGEARPAAAAEEPGRSQGGERGERRWKVWWLLWPLAVGLAAASVLLWMENTKMERELETLQEQGKTEMAAARENQELMALLTAADTVRVPLTATEGTTGSGEVRYNAKQGALLYMGQLPALPAEKSYQLWLVPEQGEPISAGVFTPDSLGNSTVVLPEMGRGIAAKAFAVTVEPAGGVAAPSGPKVLIGPVS